MCLPACVTPNHAHGHGSQTRAISCLHTPQRARQLNHDLVAVEIGSLGALRKFRAFVTK